MSRVERTALERITGLDMLLPQDFAFREVNRALRLKGRLTGIYSTGSFNDFDDTRGFCTGGLHISWVSGSTIRVAVGGYMAPNPTPITEARPGSWVGPSSPEADDDIWAHCVLPAQKDILPTVPISSATTGIEWWRVCITPTLINLEQDTARKVLDQNPVSPTYGQFVAASSLFKVTQWQATPRVVRGTPNGGLPALPADAIEIGRIFVRTGATDLSGAYFLDCRRFIEPGPNMVQGSWQNPQVSANTNTALSIWLGDVTARIGGEIVHCATRQGFAITDVSEPGATWPTVGSTTNQLAWIYLAKAGNVVARPKFKGTGLVHDEPAYCDGVIIISPTPPVIGVTASTSATGPYWDLRPSAPLAMPENTVLGWGINMGGATVQPSDAICIGVMSYALLNGATYPQLDGPVFCDEGWMRGFECNRASGPGIVAGGGGSGLTQYLTETIGFVTGSKPLPFDALRIDAYGIVVTALTTDTGGVQLGTPSNPQPRIYGDLKNNRYTPTQHYEIRIPCPGQQPPAFGQVLAFQSPTTNFVWQDVYVVKARFPYGVPLQT